MCQEVCLFRLHRVSPPPGLRFVSGWPEPVSAEGTGDTQYGGVCIVLWQTVLAKAWSLSVFFLSICQGRATCCKAYRATKQEAGQDSLPWSLNFQASSHIFEWNCFLTDSGVARNLQRTITEFLSPFTACTSHQCWPFSKAYCSVLDVCAFRLRYMHLTTLR